jgi:NAD(P)-dependent dehydrogenase (short-subunit alcohol dehydrogenase family)
MVHRWRQQWVRRELTKQLLARGDRVVGTARDTGKVADLREQYPATFRAEELDVTNTAAIRTVIERSFAQLGRIEVIISKTVWPPVTRPAWPRASSRASMWSLHRCACCSAHRRWKAP